jgi:serine/threonine-protein kinase
MLPNTQGATSPEFSPDSRSVAFEAAGGIYQVPVTGGPALPITNAGDYPHWTSDGTIVFERNGQIFQVAASGGEPELLFSSDSIVASRPHLLPGGRGVLFGTNTGGDPLNSRVLVLDRETGELRVVAPSGNHPRYVSTGYVVYGHGDQALMAVPFDVDALEATGAPVVLLPSLTIFSGGASQFDISDTGTLLYDAGGNGVVGAGGEAVLAEVGLDGTERRLPIRAGALDAPRYSPDGGRIAYEDGGEIRIFDVVTGASPQISSGGGFYPSWSPGGEYLYYSVGPEPSGDGARRRADGSEPEERLFARESGNYINVVGPGDSILVVRENSGERGLDLLLMRWDADSVVWEDYLTAQWNEGMPHLSPDGRWLAYASNETGRQRVYVHSFPTVTGQRAVSPGPGSAPMWSPDGAAIYYLEGSRLMAVEVTTEPGFSVGPPRELFDAPAYRWLVGQGRHRNYDIHPDGDRFLVVAGTEASTGVPVVSNTLGEPYIVTNWFEELKARMGGGL